MTNTPQHILDGLLADVRDKLEHKFSSDLAGALSRLKAFTEAMASARAAGLTASTAEPPPASALPPPRKVKG